MVASRPAIYYFHTSGLIIFLPSPLYLHSPSIYHQPLRSLLRCTSFPVTFSGCSKAAWKRKRLFIMYTYPFPDIHFINCCSKGRPTHHTHPCTSCLPSAYQSLICLSSCRRPFNGHYGISVSISGFQRGKR